MPRKRNRPEKIIANLREAEGLLGQGQKVHQVVTACDGLAACAPPAGRHHADKTPHHGQILLNTPAHRTRLEPWTVQHNRARQAMGRNS